MVYIDNKLFWRLESNYVYNYTDIFGHAHSLHPVDSLMVPMPVILNMNPGGILPGSCSNCVGTDSLASGPDSLSMDIKYVHYYTLKTDAPGSVDFVETGSPPYEMCGSYPQQVHSNVVLGDSTSTLMNRFARILWQ